MFKIDNTQLLNGKNGTRVIDMIAPEALSSKYDQRLSERKKLEGKDTEKMYITPDYIRGFEYDVEPIPQSTIREDEATERALEEAFQNSANTLYPDLVNREAMFEEFLRVWKKDARQLKLQPGMQPMMPMGQAGAKQSSMGQQVINRATGGPATMGVGKPSLNMLRNG